MKRGYRGLCARRNECVGTCVRVLNTFLERWDVEAMVETLMEGSLQELKETSKCVKGCPARMFFRILFLLRLVALKMHERKFEPDHRLESSAGLLADIFCVNL